MVEELVENGIVMTWLLKASRLFQEKLENVINGIPILAQSVTHHLVTASTLYDIQRKYANLLFRY